MRYNLNTVDYSRYSDLELLFRLNNLRVSQYMALDRIDAEDYEDKAEDIWSILYTRKQDEPEQFHMIDELFERADRGQLSIDEVDALREGFLPD